MKRDLGILCFLGKQDLGKGKKSLFLEVELEACLSSHNLLSVPPEILQVYPRSGFALSHVDLLEIPLLFQMMLDPVYKQAEENFSKSRKGKDFLIELQCNKP